MEIYEYLGLFGLLFSFCLLYNYTKLDPKERKSRSWDLVKIISIMILGVVILILVIVKYLF